VTVLETLVLDGIHINEIDADWTSLEGEDSNERVYDDSVERLVDGDQDTDTAQFSSDGPTFTKRFGISEAAVGETVTVTLTIDSPKGTLQDLEIDDVLPAGMIYVNGTQAVSAGITPTTPTFTSSTPNDGSAAVTLRWDFGNGIVSESPITISYDVIIANVASNQDQTILTNAATLAYTDADGGEQSLADGADLKVIEPEVEIIKEVDAGDGADGGSEVTYTLTIQHTVDSTADAYDLSVGDSLPAVLDLNVGSLAIVDTPENCANTVSDSIVDNEITITVGQLPQGCVLTASYTAGILAAVEPGQAIENTAVVEWTSTSGANANERDGSETPEYNDYNDESVASFTSAGYEISKAIVGVSQGTIGETFSFDLTITLPEGTIPGPIVVTDILPAGLAYVTGTTSLDSSGFGGTIGTGEPTTSCGACGSGDTMWCLPLPQT